MGPPRRLASRCGESPPLARPIRRTGGGLRPPAPRHLVRLTESGARRRAGAARLLRALTHQGNDLPGFVGAGAEARLPTPRKELLSIAYDGARPAACNGRSTRCKRVSLTVRDRISSDTWRVLIGSSCGSRAAHFGTSDEDARAFREPPETAGTLSDLLESIEDLVISLTAFSGLAMKA